MVPGASTEELASLADSDFMAPGNEATIVTSKHIQMLLSKLSLSLSLSPLSLRS